MAKEKVQIYTKVITDIKSPFVDTLTEQERTFWEKLEGKKKDTFLYMNHDYRRLAMGGGLTANDEAILWENGSKLAFQYANSGVKQKRIIGSTIKTASAVCLGLAVLCFGMDIYFNTYAKFRQLNLESLSVGGQKYELVPGELQKFNGHKGLLDQESLPTNAIGPEEYISHIQKPNFKCGELKSLSQTFRTDDGLPLCKENSLGDKYIVGYVRRAQIPELIMNVIHDGKIYNLDLDKELGIATVKIKGADTVNFDRVSNSFAATFPEMVREYKANAVTKLRHK